MSVSSDRTNIYIGIATAIVALAVYFRTLSPSISFWDCGEFVASSICFGIPHPPGSAVFVLIGRIFSVIPFADDIAYRVNVISALSSAASVFVAYMIITRIIGHWLDDSRGLWERLGMYIGGVVGALCMGFNKTFWTNAVEAEVYGLTTLVSLLIIYLLLKWYSNHESRGADRTLVLVSYLAILGVGIHMSAFLVMPAGFIFVGLVDRRLRTDVRFWISVIAISMIMVNLQLFLLFTGIWLIVSIIALLSFRRSRMWHLSASMVFVALLGFSIQFYAPIRSTFDPPIDMANPDNWKRFAAFVDREQYGGENMFMRMLDRRGELSNQFGDFPRMGFWRFFSEQYSDPGIVFLLLLILGTFGIYSGLSRNLKIGTLMLLLVLAGTIGLTLYMNFADGTQIDPNSMARRLEVRDRDYFWTPGFAFFGMCIGIGVAALYYALRRRLAASGDGGSMANAVSAAMVVLVLIPALALGSNYRVCDRSMDTMPYDYAHNTLNSCRENSILFTAGDNDTYPLWALQYGLGIRTDVHVVNLSLLDVDWYILQKKSELAPLGNLISLDTNQIQTADTLIRGMRVNLPSKPYYDAMRKETRLLHPFPDEQGKVVRTAHQIVENILLNNLDSDGNFKYDICFANLPPAEVKYDLRAHSERVGLVYRITREIRNRAVNLDETYYLVTNVFQYRNLSNPKYYRDETGTSMALSAGQRIFDAYREMAASDDSARALDIFEFIEDNIPEFWEPPLLHATVDSMYGLESKPDSVYKLEYLAFVDDLLKYAPDSYYYHQFRGMALQELGRADEAIVSFETAYEVMPTSSLAYRSLIAAYVQSGRYVDAVNTSREYLILNPHDVNARRLVNAYSTQQMPQRQP
jgi:tetratricopeptide (TPR) repeat protein